MKYLKRPINKSETASSIVGEIIEIVLRNGKYCALLRENPDSVTSVTVATAARTLQNDSNAVADGYYKIRTTVFNGETVNIPILEFHANDVGLEGEVSYSGLGTSITAEYLDDALSWNQHLTGYATVELLAADYPATTNTECRGHAGDMAVVGPDESGGYSLHFSTGSTWELLGGSAAINHAPVASSASITVLKDVGSTIVLTAADADGNPLSYTITSQPTHGTLTGSAPLLTYTPTPNYTGADSFTFKASDGVADSNIATISLTVANAVRTITVTQPSNGTITPSGAVSVADGGSQIFTIAPASGYSITSLTVDGGTVADTDGSYTFSNVTADHTLTAVIADITAPVVTFSAGTPIGLTFPITLSATDSGSGVTGYMVKENNTTPLIGDSDWVGTAPTSKTASGYTTTELHAWAKDAAGNVSNIASVTGLSLSAPILFSSPMLTSGDVATWTKTYNVNALVFTADFDGSACGKVSCTETANISANTAIYKAFGSPIPLPLTLEFEVNLNTVYLSGGGLFIGIHTGNTGVNTSDLAADNCYQLFMQHGSSYTTGRIGVQARKTGFSGLLPVAPVTNLNLSTSYTGWKKWSMNIDASGNFKIYNNAGALVASSSTPDTNHTAFNSISVILANLAPGTTGVATYFRNIKIY